MGSGGRAEKSAGPERELETGEELAMSSRNINIARTYTWT
jgi:hypothetical protein